MPFLISIVLVGVSLYIRLRMKESPIFQHIKGTGMTSAKPLKEAFTQWANLKRVLISLFGATAGQGVVWYTGQFYALFYLQTILKVNDTSANYIVAIALLLGMPFFVVFGALSDRIGRKRIMMAGCLLAAVSYLPDLPGDAGARGIERRHRRVAAQSRDRRHQPDAADDRRRGAAAGSGSAAVRGRVGRCCRTPTAWQLILLVFIQVVFVTMVYGPIAAYLVEAFPARIRYTALSLPYHIGNGVFGGLLPLIGLCDRRADRQHLRRSLLPDRRGRADVRGRLAAAHGNAQRADLARSAG